MTVCRINACVAPAVEDGKCPGHAEADRERALRVCETCGLQGYPWGTLVPFVKTWVDGRTMCFQCRMRGR